MAAGIGSMNFFYQRYSETAGIPTAQPASGISTYVDAGFGWSRFQYRNFNLDYEKYSDTAGILTAQPPRNGTGYVRYSDTAGIITTQPAPYLRHDANNVGYITAGNQIPNIEP